MPVCSGADLEWPGDRLPGAGIIGKPHVGGVCLAHRTHDRGVIRGRIEDGPRVLHNNEKSAQRRLSAAIEPD